MDWDPEIHDPTGRPRPPEEGPGPAEPSEEPPFVDPFAPFAPIDPNAPVSGHRPPPAPSRPASESPEQDWSAARASIFPLLRPVGTAGMAVTEFDPSTVVDATARSHTQPLIDEGPAGLPVVYALRSGAFDVIVNADHLLTWGIGVTDLQDAALANLAAWSAKAPWTDEVSGERRLLSSSTGEGWDASRILLPDVAEYIARELGGGGGRILVGIPDRHTLAATSLGPSDMDFAVMFEEFVVETSGAADEPIERRVFELVGGRLTPFVP
jgi:hypothetical protein